MKYSIQGGDIVLSQVGEYYEPIFRAGVYRWNRRDRTLRAPVTLESLQALESAAGRLPEPLRVQLRVLQRRERMLQTQRELLTGDPKPLAHYPVKARLMRHQIVGANMALIVFGMFDQEEDRHDA